MKSEQYENLLMCSNLLEKILQLKILYDEQLWNKKVKLKLCFLIFLIWEV